MTADLGSYPAYQASGEPWLGPLPRAWDLERTKVLLRERTEKGHPDEPLLAATQTKGVVRKEDYENRTVVAVKDLQLLKLVREGDFVISLRSFQGGIELARDQGIISPAYTILDPRDPDMRGYLAWVFKSQPYVNNLSLYVTGIRQGQNIDYERLSRSRLPVPPPNEQAAIVRYLGHLDRRIRGYITAKRKLIALLDEQKQAIVHQAVTRGIDPRVPVRPSGVELLGDVPNHWQVEPLRRRWTVTDCKHLTVPFVEDGIPLASVREVRPFDLDLATSKRTTHEWYKELVQGGRAPRRGDIVYCRNVSVGAAAFVSTDAQFAMGQDVCLIRSIGQNQRYLNYFLHSPAMQRQLARLLVGSTFKRINVADIKSLIVAVPPRSEQDAIADVLDADLDRLDRPVRQARRQIGLMVEYRARLIADVVTGKLDVREAAVKQTAEPEAAEPIDLGKMIAEGDLGNEADGDLAADEDPT